MNATITTKCAKCNGRGHILAFSGIAGGICFDCKGAGQFVETVATVERRKARAAAAARREVARREAYLDSVAHIHAVWEQRADLIVDRFAEITPAAITHIASRDELWESDMLWIQTVDSVRGNLSAVGF